jgi:hypothetical protein
MKTKVTFVTLIIISLSSLITAQDNKNIFIFGNSLIVHEPPAIATPSDETTVPHWLHFLSEASNRSVAISGQYGFLQQHDDLPPFSQWGFDSVTPAWESDTEPFSDANFDTVLITCGNFIQDQSSNMPYYNDPNTTPLSATLSIVDWVKDQNPNMATYIYENWPDMAGFLANGFPASTSEFQAYNNYTENEFHDWWLEYQDFLVANRPDDDIKMIPIGPVISKLLSEAPFNQIPITDLYEDDAPHGRPTLYFLAAMITYTAIFQTPTPTGYLPPSIINSIVVDNYDYITDFIWTELLNFNFEPSSESRVFLNNPLNTEDSSLLEVEVYPNPTENKVYINTEFEDIKVSCFDSTGKKINIHFNAHNKSLDISNLSAGIFFIKLTSGEKNVIKKILKIKG